VAYSRSDLSYNHTSATLAAIFVAALTGFVGVSPAVAALDLLIQCHPYTVHVNSNGAVIRIEKQGSSPITVGGAADNAGSLVYGTTALPLERPTLERPQATGCGRTFLYDLATKPRLLVRSQIEAHVGKGQSLVLVRKVDIQRSEDRSERLTGDLTVKLPLWPPLEGDAWLPLFDGRAGRLGDQAACVYKFAGATPTDGVRLAVPMVSCGGASLGPRATICTDPYFSSLFTRKSIEWTYPKRIGLEDQAERRTVVTVFHAGGAEDALAAFFAEALPDVPAGPPWLHEIAMVDYDYMSDAGNGWYADIDALTKAVPRDDRGKVFLCLHGWYDWVGRYCFDVKGKKFDEQWTAFGNYEKTKNAPPTMKIDGETVDVDFAKCLPAQLTLANVHERLAYARSRGFRVGMYFADGTAAGAELADFDPKRVLTQGGWGGPDMSGKPYVANPLVADVYKFYLAYTDALLAEFGRSVDAFVWDETFHVPTGSLGSKDVPGYADRAMMRLVRTVAKKVEDHNQQNHRQIALLTSDDLGVNATAAPYALVAHGTYQDSWCDPRAWSYGIFPNFRNSVWSCCWWPVHKWKWIDFAVRQYQAPVAISNGWGDNVGFAEMSPDMQRQVLAMFQWRKQKPTRLEVLEKLPSYR
jgi:hypothetical protein